MDYIRKAYELDSISGNTIRMARRLSQMGDIFNNIERAKEARNSYRRAIALLETTDEKHSLSITYRQLGTLYLKQGKRVEGIECLKKAAAICEETHELNTLNKIYQRLSEAYHGLDMEQENLYLKLYTAVKDSLTAEQKQREMTEFKVRYDTDSQTALADENTRKLSSTRFWAGIIFVLLIIPAIILLFMIRRRNRHNRLLRKQLEILRQQMSEQRELYIEQQQKREGHADLDPVDQKFIEDINKAIFDLMGKADVSADNVASRLCVTPQQLRRRVQSILGVSSIAYINSVRIDYAKDLLKNQPQLTITEIGALCGFDEPSHFSRAFHKETGVSPSEFRNQE